MDQSAFTSDLLIEHIGSASVVPFVSSLTLEAMELFGGYDLQAAAKIALVGVVIGCLLNWLLGYAIARLRDKVTFLGKEDFAEMQGLFRKYGFMLAALHFLPLGSILVVITGFFRAPLWKVGIAVLIGAVAALKDYLLV